MDEAPSVLSPVSPVTSASPVSKKNSWPWIILWVIFAIISAGVAAYFIHDYNYKKNGGFKNPLKLNKNWYK